MDPVSHALLGAAAAQSTARESRLRAVSLAAAAGALAPDLDLLIRSAGDPVLTLEVHRQFTHALAFAPLGALASAALIFRLVRAQARFLHAYVAALIGYTSHVLLDACTTYGTVLFWPFSQQRIAWSTLAVADFAFTLPLTVLVAVAVIRRRPRFAVAGVAWVLGYFAFSALQAERAAAAATALAISRGHTAERMAVIPALFSSLVLWKVVYENGGRYYVDAIRTGFVPAVYPGVSTAKLDIARHFPWLDPASQQAVDVERFRRVAGDLLAVDEASPNRIVDLRYSLVPNEIAGFWAIVLDPSAARDAHVGLVPTRDNAPRDALRLIDMLFE
jgi:inner membrane protein